MAWNFVNDSLTTTVCLQWEPEIIAVALIHLASKLSKFTVSKWAGQQPTHLRWWDMFVSDVTMEILEDICHQVLDLYQQANPSNAESPPQLPPSKASPPPKRAKITPTIKSSPIPNVAKQTIDEKLESMPLPKSVTTDNANYAYPPAYGTMFSTHFQQPPPTSQSLPPYSSHAPPAHAPPPHASTVHAPPPSHAPLPHPPPPHSHVPTIPPPQHYQSHPPPNPNYYQQPPPMPRGGFYPGPP